MAKEKYPKRGAFFCSRFTRMLFRVCAPNDIGHEACLLLIHIAHTEDSKQYRAPVTFWNFQLESVMHISRYQLIRIRKKAIEAGWLHYEREAKRSVGKYWVKIPEQFKGMRETVLGENFEAFEEVNVAQVQHEMSHEPHMNRTSTAHEPHTFLPNPNPNPKDKDPPIVPQEKNGGGSPTDVVDYWNRKSQQHDELSHWDHAPKELLRKLASRLRDPSWPWQEAIDMLPLGGNYKGQLTKLAAEHQHAYAIVAGEYRQYQKQESKHVVPFEGETHD